jgi:hypothetical protein
MYPRLVGPLFSLAHDVSITLQEIGELRLGAGWRRIRRMAERGPNGLYV